MRNTDNKDNLKKSLIICAGFFAGCGLGYVIGRIAGNPQMYTAVGGVIGLAIVMDLFVIKKD